MVNTSRSGEAMPKASEKKTHDSGDTRPDINDDFGLSKIQPLVLSDDE